MPKGNGELMHECFPKQWEQQEWNKIKKQMKKDGKKRGVSMERSKAGTKKTSPDGLSHPNQNTIIIKLIL